jgi:hypothetical protein
MANKTSSKLQKVHYQTYKTTNQALTNKIKKLERHCKRFPDDEQGAINLKKAKNGEYKPRSKPLAPGSNPTTPKIKLMQVGHVFGPKTAGEQLSELLGRPMPIVRTRRRKPKAVITHKPRRK